jgi:hypothetical protein
MDESARLQQASSWLKWLYGEKFDGNVWIGTPVDWRGRRFTDLDEAARYAIILDGECGASGVYHRLTTMNDTALRRGTVADSVSLPAIMADLDLKGPGHKALNYPETRAQYEQVLGEAGLPDPTTWIESGGGVYPVWRLAEPILLTDPDVIGQTRDDVRRVHRAIIDAAKVHDWKVDNTSDLARVYRMPGTTNRKPGMPEPVVARWWPGEAAVGARFALADVVGRLVAPLAVSAPAPASGGGSVLFTPSMQGWAGETRSFTIEQARAFTAPALLTLRSARDGEINVRLNEASCALAHFGDEFWSTDQADAVLQDALSATAYDGATWRAADTIASARRAMRGPEQWRAAFVSAADVAIEIAPSNLPAEFWESRPNLRLIRDVAHERLSSADAVFGGVLARIAAALPPKCGPDTGIGGDTTSLNLIVSLVAPSGGGKSSGLRVVDAVMPENERWNPHALPLGSGEGIAESFMGMVEREDEETGKTKKVRDKVYDNVLLHKDEGAELVRMLERQGSTVSEALRSAWSGEALGQQNGRADTTRIIPAGTYSLGMTIGFQPAIAGRLFTAEQVELGTVQRFLWLSAVDATIPDDVEDKVMARLELPGAFAESWKGSLLGQAASEVTKLPKMTIADSIKVRLRAERLAKQRGTLTVEPLDSHKPLLLVKLSCLLAVLDGRMNATEEDWGLAEQVLAVSGAVRTRIRQATAREQERESIARLKRREAEAAANERGRQTEAQACIAKHVELIAGKLRTFGEGRSKRQIRDWIYTKHRGCLDEALGQGCETGVLKVSEGTYSA